MGIFIKSLSELGWQKAIWEKGDKTVSGMFRYNYGPDSFSIVLDEKDIFTGEKISTITTNDDVSFNG